MHNTVHWINGTLKDPITFGALLFDVFEVEIGVDLLRAGGTRKMPTYFNKENRAQDS